MIKWIFALIGIVVMSLGMYLVYNIGLNEGFQKGNGSENTVQSMAKIHKKKNNKIKKAEDNSSIEMNLTKITTDIGVVVSTTYNQGANKVTKYYKEIDMNNTKTKVENVKNYIVEFYEDAVQGAKDSYVKMTEKTEKLDKTEENK